MEYNKIEMPGFTCYTIVVNNSDNERISAINKALNDEIEISDTISDEDLEFAKEYYSTSDCSFIECNNCILNNSKSSCKNIAYNILLKFGMTAKEIDNL